MGQETQSHEALEVGVGQLEDRRQPMVRWSSGSGPVEDGHER